MPVYTNEKGLPEAFVSAVARDPRRYDGSTYSVTELLKGEREILLSRRHDAEITVDVSECVWTVFGSAVHKVFEEQPQAETELRERRLRAPAAGGRGVVTGQFDSYDTATGEIVDWKTAGTWKFAKQDFADWRTQALGYAWLLFEEGYEPVRARFVALLKDFSSAKAGKDGYPDAPVAEVVFPVTREAAYEVGGMLSEKVGRLIALLGAPDEELPVCTEAERWARPKTYAVFKDGAARATRDFKEDRDAAEEFADGKGLGYSVVERGGGDGKCERFCPAAPFCTHWQENYAGAE